MHIVLLNGVIRTDKMYPSTEKVPFQRAKYEAAANVPLPSVVMLKVFEPAMMHGAIPLPDE